MKKTIGISLVIFTLALAQVDTAWVRRWDGTAHLDERPTAIALDSSGNLLVTGNTQTDTILGHEDIITLKYSPTGELLWARQYGTPNGLDRSYAVACDRQGNVYVTGELDRARHMVVLKYDSMGTLKWVRQYGNYGSDLGLDQAGNIYVCGDTYQNQTLVDFITIKYRPNGDTAWVRISDVNNDNDAAMDLVVNRSGGVTVCGDCWGATPGCAIRTLRYDSTGKLLWSAIYDKGLYQEPGDIVIDPEGILPGGNIIVSGIIIAPDSTRDYLTLKYSPQGELLWARTYSGIGHGNDYPLGMAVDRYGNVFVTGVSREGNNSLCCTTIKYDYFGNQAWVVHYVGPYPAAAGCGIAIGRLGYAYITGYEFFGLNDQLLLLIKYNQNGDTVWVRHLNIPQSGGYTILVDEQGRIYVAGYSWAGLVVRDILIIKYVQAGGIAETLSEPAQRLVLFAEPNPFQDQTTVRFGPVSGSVRAGVYDVTGKLVKRLTPMETGLLRWNRTGGDNKRVPAGVYTLIIANGKQQATVKLIALPRNGMR